MVKKGAKKNSKAKKRSTTRKKPAHKKVTHHAKPRIHHAKEITQTATEVKVERILVENFVALQKVMVNLSGKVDSLIGKIEKLFGIFELSAKALAEKDFEFDKGSLADENSETILQELHELKDQNKIIAKGLTLIHETNNIEPVHSESSEPTGFTPEPPPFRKTSNSLNHPMTKPVGPTTIHPPRPKPPKPHLREPRLVDKPQESPEREGYQKSIVSEEGPLEFEEFSEEND